MWGNRAVSGDVVWVVLCVCVCVYLFKARRHTPAAGLHDAVIAAHVFADLSVLFTALLSAGQERRVTKERRNTITGQSGSSGREERERESEALAAGQQQERAI